MLSLLRCSGAGRLGAIPIELTRHVLAPRVRGCSGVPHAVEHVLERARCASRDLGHDPSALYEPWLPVDWCQQSFVLMQGALGDGALAVVACACLLRVATFPWNLRALQRQCDRIVLFPVYLGLARGIEDAKKRRDAPSTSTHMAAQADAELATLTAKYEDFIRSTMFSPLQGMGYQLTCVMPAYLLSYFALRGVMLHPDSFRSFVVAPTLWVDSLVLSDPCGVLPVVSALSVLANAELNSQHAPDQDEEAVMYMRFAIRGAMLAFVPLTAMLPSGMLVFMATNATYTAVVTWLFRRYRWVPAKVESRWLKDAGAVARDK